MVAMSTCTSPFLACQMSPVPMSEPATLYMRTCPFDTASALRWSEEQPPSTKAAVTANGKTARRSIIFDSRFEVSRRSMTRLLLDIADLELRPKNDCSAILHPARVLRGNSGAGVHLDPDHLVSVHEVVDVAGCR